MKSTGSWIQLALFLILSGFGVALWGENSGAEKQFLSHIRQLIYEGQRSGEGYFSPDGNNLIFQSEREPGNPFFQIYILSFLTGETWRVSPGIGKTTCAFFRPGSDEVLFGSTHLDPAAPKKQQEEIALRQSGKQRRYSWDYDPYMDIFSAKRDGSGLRQLTTSRGYDAEGAYSPDGQMIVFCSMRDAYPPENLSPEDQKRLEVDPSYFGEIYIMDADGAHQKRLTHWPGYDGGPFFSPDGRRIIWRHFTEEGTIADIYTMNLDGTDRRRLTDFGAMSWAPYFHPSGEYAIFTTNKHGFGNFELYLVDAAGEKEPVRVTYTDGFDGLAVFSPDGEKLAWTSGRGSDGKNQIFLADWHHRAALDTLAAAPLRGKSAGMQVLPKIKLDRVKRVNDAGMAVDGSAASEFNKKYNPEITVADLQDQVGYLAGDALEGRLTGTPGTEKARKFLAHYFKSGGLEPAGENGTYFQEFPFTSGVRALPDKNELHLILPDGTRQSLALDTDFRPLGFSENGTAEGEVVFAGYGLTIPGEPGTDYDSYAGLDVQDKIVLVLRYAPQDVEMTRRQELNRYAGLRYKALLARENGARALLVVTGPNSPTAGELVPLGFDQGMGNSGIPVVTIRGGVAETMFTAAGKKLQAVQAELDRENPHFEGAFPLSGVRIRLQTGVEREESHDRNVLALLPPGGDWTDREYVLLGAHYDHLGRSTAGSLARSEEVGQIHNGADDNASGTALVLEVAASLAKLRRENPELFRRGVVFALWSGEELGIVGSSHFAENPTLPLEKVVAYLNFDMVGRLRDNQLTLQGIGSSTYWKKMIERRNVLAGFNLSLIADPYQPTDLTAFYPKGIPVLGFFTGSHPDYHRPTDDPETLNYQGLRRIAELAQNLTLDLVRSEEVPEYVKVERKPAQQGERASLRAYLGTVPDYVTDIAGVKLSDVRPGGPADKAGVRGGDIIVGLAGQKITNIYDYTYALDAVKVGQPTEIVVLRNGEEIKMTIVPQARQ